MSHAPLPRTTMPSHRWTHLTLGFAAALSTLAQTSDVTQCIPDAQWTINDKKQTPCLVAAFLESACGNPTSVNAIPANMHYLGPTGPQQTPCMCSSVTYSMVSACGVCQGRTFQNWTTWILNCDKPALATFPRKIPPAVTVPEWAFINVSFTGNTFDPVVAQGVLGGVPAPTASMQPPTTSATPLPGSTASTSNTQAPDAAPTVTQPQASSGSKSNTGAIAGGVVGGLLALALIVLAVIWWFVRRRRNAVQSDLVFNARALVSNNPPITQQTTGSSGMPLTSLYETTTGSNYPPSGFGTSAVYTSAPTASRRSEESISYSMAHFGGGAGGYQPSLQPVRQKPGYYRGAAEIS